MVPTVCMAVGLWMQYRNGQTAIRQSLELKVWDRIGPVVLMLGRAHPSESPSDAVLSEAAGGLSDEAHPSGGVTRVDRRGVVVAHFPDSGSTGSSESVPETPAAWRPFPTAAADPNGATRGILTLADGRHYAVRLTGESGDSAVFVHQPVAVVNDEVAALTHSLPAISAITLVWISAVLSISVFVMLGRTHEQVDSQRVRAAAETLRQARNLARTQDAVIFGLAKLADSRDSDTGAHLDRITAYATLLASAARQHPDFSREIDSEFVRLIGISSALHDIGKVGVGDDVLLKPGPLSPAERRRMQQHTLIGGECLRSIEQRLGSSNFLQMAREIALSHHERWDGGGYPAGLAGGAIPLAARIVAIADVYDALSSKRVYKPAFTHAKCVEIIRECANDQFDSKLVEIWLSIEPRFREISRRSTRESDAVSAQEFTLTGSEIATEERPLAAAAGG